MVVATQSALIVAVPEADPVVGMHRARFDRAAAWGVPAHVTVLYPFIAPKALTDDDIARAAKAIATVPAFAPHFGHTEWFEEDALFLMPNPSAPFSALTDAVVAAFPTYLPYQGAQPAVVPHLTVGYDAPLEALREAEQEVLRHLPLSTHVTAVEWWQGSDRPRSWRRFATLPLG